MKRHRKVLLVSLAACLAIAGMPPAVGQAPAAAPTTAAAPSADALEKLVGPIALYPDDLVAIILPSATNPLQVVQADRFLDKRKKDPKLPIDDKWDEAVKSLVNYPDVIKKMSADLDWTTDLGEAVVANQQAVMDAVQAFRRKAQSVGNLKTDTKQTIVVEKEVIKIVPADPQVIYVPQYNPSTVVVYSSAPVWGYYPTAYPVYYYPYPPGAALATGIIWGAAIGAAWNGGHYAAHYGGGNNNITINRGNTNINTGNINTGNVGSGNRSNTATQNTAWKSDKKAGQVSSGNTSARTTSASSRVGDTAGNYGGGGRSGGSAGVSSSNYGGGGTAGSASRNSASATSSSRGGGGGGGGALGGYGSGSSARADSARGASSRSSMSGGGRSSGGGSRGGGGGGRGGGRR